MNATLRVGFTDIVAGDELAAALMAGDSIEIVATHPGCSDLSCCESQIDFLFDGDRFASGLIYAHLLLVGDKTLKEVMKEGKL